MVHSILFNTSTPFPRLASDQHFIQVCLQNIVHIVRSEFSGPWLSCSQQSFHVAFTYLFSPRVERHRSMDKNIRTTSWLPVWQFIHPGQKLCYDLIVQVTLEVRLFWSFIVVVSCWKDFLASLWISKSTGPLGVSYRRRDSIVHVEKIILNTKKPHLPNMRYIHTRNWQASWGVYLRPSKI